ncbi:MAG: VCBS repeat-containing protein [Planctomycetes bacterium]|nr:VCBS repeat-containing protein [Planctomycetota bacterium]
MPCDIFGAALARIADVNGDGVPDVLVGAPQPSSCGPIGPGYVDLRSGTDGALLYTLTGVSIGDQYGAAVAGTGDVDGDGVPDLLVGIPGADPGGLTNAGELALRSGVGGAIIWTIPGGAANERLGQSVAALGDVDGDGIDDVAAQAPGPFTTGAIGSVRVFSTATGALLYTLTAPGPVPGFGLALAGPGDVNGDGAADLLVGDSAASPAGVSAAGEARLYSGLTGTLLFAVAGSAAGDLLGAAVTGPGDLDGDGVPDFVVGGPRTQSASPAPGYVSAVSGSSGGVLYTVNGASPLDGFGGAVGSMGDVDGDGVSDLVVGTAGANGVLRYVRVVSGANGALRMHQSGSFLQDFAGRVAGTGDLNGDGIPDLAISAPLTGGPVRALSVAGLPPGSSVLGTGCPGSGGIVPQITTGGGYAHAQYGNPAFALGITEALGGALAFLIAGGNSANWLGLPLPLNLGFLGMPGCSLGVPPEWWFAAATSGSGPGAGHRFIPIPVPVVPALVGGNVFFQWLVIDTGVGPLPLAMTPALRVFLDL